MRVKFVAMPSQQTGRELIISFLLFFVLFVFSHFVDDENYCGAEEDEAGNLQVVAVVLKLGKELAVVGHYAVE